MCHLNNQKEKNLKESFKETEKEMYTSKMYTTSHQREFQHIPGLVWVRADKIEVDKLQLVLGTHTR